MNLKELTIEGYKSIGKITISNPNPFTVFVGPNASGKSNIFEALDLFALRDIMNKDEALKKFGNYSDIVNQVTNYTYISIQTYLGGLETHIKFTGNSDNTDASSFRHNILDSNSPSTFRLNADYVQFFNFTRLFTGKYSLDRRKYQDDSRLNTDASNLEKVLKRILKDENKREEIHEILHLLIPGFEKVEIKTEELSGSDSMIVYETNLKRPLPKSLISDGTYNILAIIAALYQSDEPQFLCIEEPENGLNPMVIKELANIIRSICEEKGHYVWLNTHSQSLVSVLTTEEIILVDKKKGLTQIKQIQGMDLFGLRMDEALLTNAIGGGIPW